MGDGDVFVGVHKTQNFFRGNFENIHTDHILTEEPARLASVVSGGVAIPIVR